MLQFSNEQKRKNKSLIEFYKAIIIAFMTALFSVLGYTFIHYENFSVKNIFIISFSVVVLLAVLAVFVALFIREIKQTRKGGIKWEL